MARGPHYRPGRASSPLSGHHYLCPHVNGVLILDSHARMLVSQSSKCCLFELAMAVPIITSMLTRITFSEANGKDAEDLFDAVESFY